MKKINFFQNKSLLLNNVLFFRAGDGRSFLDDPCLVMIKMESYIKTRNAKQVGPLIQHIIKRDSESGITQQIVEYILQCDTYLDDLEEPYLSEHRISLSNAMYVRFFGPKNKLNLALAQIEIEAFENEIELGNEIYIIFVNDADVSDCVIDVFVPKKGEG